MKPVLLIFFSASLLFVQAQNLIPNPSFETFSTCPVGFSQYTGYVSTWTNPSTASPDYYNACANPNPAGTPVNGFGYQPARTGNAYSGFYATAGTYREFIQVQLTTPLTAGMVYRFNMYVNCHNRSKFVTDDLGAFFSASPPTSAGTGFLSGNPVPQVKNPTGFLLTDTLNWMLITGTFTAVGGERYVTIGHFLPDSLCTYVQVNYGTQGSYYYIDDASLIPSTPLPVTLLTFTASPQLSSIRLEWETASEVENDFFDVQRSADGWDFQPIGKADGNGTTTEHHFYQFDDNHLSTDPIYFYRLRQVDYDGREHFSKTIAVRSPRSDKTISIYPNPAHESFVIDNQPSLAKPLTLLNSLGQVMDHTVIKPGMNTISLEGFVPGMYYLKSEQDGREEFNRLVVQ